MAKKPNDNSQAAIEQELIDAIKNSAETDENIVANNISTVVPTITDPSWTDYILNQLDENEVLIKKNKQGQEQARYPKVNGLRRVFKLYLGTVIKSYPTPVSVVFEPETKSYISTFIYTIAFIPHASVNDERVTVEYADVGETLFSDGGGLSNIDKKFGKYPSALAVTRGEARALRKALCLSVVAAEEFDKELPETPESDVQMIKPIQKAHIELKCKNYDIKVEQYIAKYNYKNINDITYGDAALMWKELDNWQRDKKKLEEFKSKQVSQ